MQDGISIGPLTIHFYGIIIMFGALAAAFLATIEAKRRKIDPEMVWDMLPYLLIAGVIGARIWHILTPPASMVDQGITPWYYLTHPLDAIAIWKGGLGIPGGIIGGAIALYIYCKKKNQSFAVWADIAIPGVALAQAIGRWGNFINQEVYGAPTNLPWAIFIDPLHRLPEYINTAYYHPLFAYESFYNLLNMALLLWIGRKYVSWLKDGDIFLIYLIVYPIGRFFLEFLRLDPSPVGGVNINQTIMGLISIAATVLLVVRHKSGQPATATTVSELDEG